MIKQHSSQTHSILAWLSVSLFFFFQYILRVAPGVMVTELRTDFHMTAEQFSLFGALFLYAYSLVQIPMGIALDQFGVKRVVSACILLFTGAGVMFSMTDQLWVANLARLFMGLGASTAFMSGVKIAADEFPAGKRGFYMGATLTIGLIGAFGTGKPLVWAMDTVGNWRETLLGISLFGIAILGFVHFSVPRQKIKKDNFSLPVLKTSLFETLKNRNIMMYAALAVGVYTPISVLADLWGTAFLMEKFNLSRNVAAPASATMYAGMALGCIVLPWICEKYELLNRGIQACTLGMFLCFGFLLYGPALGESQLFVMLLTLGFFCGAEMMCFTAAVRFTTRENSGITIGIVNTFNVLGGAILQQVIGFILDQLWQGAVDDAGNRLYNAHDYVVAMTSLLFVVGVCLALSTRLGADQRSDSNAAIA